MLEFRLRYFPAFGAGTGSEDEQPSVQDTPEAWQSWEAENTSYDGAFPGAVRRSS